MNIFSQKGSPPDQPTGLGKKMRRVGQDLLVFFRDRTGVPDVEDVDRYTYRSYELIRRHRMSRFFKQLRMIYFSYCFFFYLAAYPYLNYTWVTAIILTAVAVGYVLLRQLLTSDQERDRTRSFYLDLVDYLLLGAVVYFTGGVRSFFSGAFVLPVIATTLRFGAVAGLCGFGMTISLIGLNALPNPFFSADLYPIPYYLFFNLGTMIITALSVNKLVEDEIKLSGDIYHNSVTDPLTGLFHSGYIRERIREEIANCKRRKERFSLVFLDLNRFKEINDLHGHLVGDGMLRHIAFILRSVARRGETLSRYAGDEFLLLLPGAGMNEARETLNRLMWAVESQPYHLDNGIPLWISASGGIAEYPIDGLNLEQLLQVADENMYRTKRNF